MERKNLKLETISKFKNQLFALGGMSMLAQPLYGEATAQTGTAQPLNFINILVDDMGYADIGCMGGPVETPNLDQLAESGILFTDYRTYPKCAPTRDAIMTGMDAPPVRTEKDGVTLAEALKPAGYGTYFVGKAHRSVIGSMKARRTWLVPIQKRSRNLKKVKRSSSCTICPRILVKKRIWLAPIQKGSRNWIVF